MVPGDGARLPGADEPRAAELDALGRHQEIDPGEAGEGRRCERRDPLRGRHPDPEAERTLIELEIFVEQTRLKLQLMADGWHSFERVPVRPRRTKLTPALDADMVDWFRLLGEGWHARINDVLRVFMLSVQSKEVHTERDYDWRGRRLTRRR